MSWVSFSFLNTWPNTGIVGSIPDNSVLISFSLCLRSVANFDHLTISPTGVIHSNEYYRQLLIINTMYNELFSSHEKIVFYNTFICSDCNDNTLSRISPKKLSISLYDLSLEDTMRTKWNHPFYKLHRWFKYKYPSLGVSLSLLLDNTIFTLSWLRCLELLCSSAFKFTFIDNSVISSHPNFNWQISDHSLQQLTWFM